MTFADELAEYQAEGIKVNIRGQIGLVDGFKSTEGSGGWVRLASDSGEIITTINFDDSKEVKKA